MNEPCPYCNEIKWKLVVVIATCQGCGFIKKLSLPEYMKIMGMPIFRTPVQITGNK